MPQPLTNNQIALQFLITQKTVKTHLTHLLHKLPLAHPTQPALHPVRNPSLVSPISTY
ncbi:LuxR C-terminal-related transcriptional regulator, partial [Paenibacillus xylanexedens]|uniref:LuxR C-terminal-related transcriptional regulator n=1 Tax=Paenibacillus xylanexedens TaxID=528191 RepID=UPI0034D957CE